MKLSLPQRVLAAASLALCAVTPAHAYVIDFDEVVVPSRPLDLDYISPSKVYKGLVWGGTFGHQSWAISPDSATQAWGFAGEVAHSGHNFVWTTSGDDVSLAAPSGYFSLNSFWARRSSHVTPATPVVHGFRDGVEVFQRTLSLQVGYQLFNLSFNGVDKVTITDHGPILLDDISVSAVPEPSSYALLLGGLAMLGAVARRRKGAAAR